MKKLLGISLIAMMAVTSARADIASKAYVDPAKGTYVDPDTMTAGQNIKKLDDMLGAGFSTENTVADKIAAAVSGASTALDNYYTKDEADAAFDAKNAASTVKTTVDAYTVNSKAISSNPVLSGADVAATGYTKASEASAIAATDTMNQALGKLEYKVDTATTAATTAASDSAAGVAKLYASTGQNTDGSMTQKAVTDALGAKANTADLGALAAKDSVAETDLATDLATKINGKADQTALTTEINAREAGDTAINDKIGGNFNSTNTVAKAIQDAQSAATNAVTAEKTGTGNLVSNVSAANGKVTITVDGVALQDPKTSGTDGVYVLTASTADGQNTVYKWENIARGN